MNNYYKDRKGLFNNYIKEIINQVPFLGIYLVLSVDEE